MGMLTNAAQNAAMNMRIGAMGMKTGDMQGAREATIQYMNSQQNAEQLKNQTAGSQLLNRFATILQAGLNARLTSLQAEETALRQGQQQREIENVKPESEGRSDNSRESRDAQESRAARGMDAARKNAQRAAAQRRRQEEASAQQSGFDSQFAASRDASEGRGHQPGVAGGYAAYNASQEAENGSRSNAEEVTERSNRNIRRATAERNLNNDNAPLQRPASVDNLPEEHEGGDDRQME